MADVFKVKLWDGFLAPGQETTCIWNITQMDAWLFYAVPRVSQNAFPQTIQILYVRIETFQSTKFRALIRLYNPTPPKNIPQQDGCFYSMYKVQAV